MIRIFFFLISFVLLIPTNKAQVSYGSAAAFGMRKLIPGYQGNAIQVRRTCDNGVTNIGFSTCGDLDTVALKKFVIAANPLSATTVTAATAYSLRRLSCSYAGSAIRVRSSAVGSPTLDIGFTANGDLDTAALKTFVGSNSAFVTIWYDQSSKLRHAGQATAGSQPRIVNAGVIDRQGGMPALRWLGMGYFMNTAAYTTYGTAACFNAVARVGTDVTYNTIVNKTTVNYPAPLDLYNAQMVVGNGAAYSFFGYGQTFNSALPLSVWTYQAASGGSYNFYYNGGLTASGTVGSYGDNGNPLTLGSRSDGVTGLNGWISEIITFDALPSATDRQFLEWSQSQYYSTSGPALVLPASPASAYVATWYDQSGNLKDAVQLTASSQARIINAGLIEKNSSIPAVFFNGLLQNVVAPLPVSAYPVTMSLLANTSGSSTAGAFVKLGTDVNLGQAGVAIGIGSSGGSFLTAGTSVIGVKEWVANCPSSPNVNYPATPFISTTIQQPGSGGMSTYLNGANVPLSNSASAVGAAISGSLLLGGYVNSSLLFPAVRESEVIIFPTDLSVTRRTLLETNQAAYSAVSISNSKYTPPTATTYNRFVAGVGRESATDSVSGTRSTVGMGFVIGQAAGDFLKDNGDYLTIGINCPVGAALSTANLPATVVQRWSNDWYLNKTDVGANNGTITIYFDFGEYGMPGMPGTASNYVLLARNSPAATFSIVAGTTKSVVNDRVQFAVDAANIPTNSYYTIATTNSVASTLPIELLAFDATCSADRVNVNWTVASQINNAYFTIERTLDGVRFETLGQIKGAGTTREKKSYAFTDNNPFIGTSYYRLKQTDNDGSEKHYKLAAVLCDASPELKIYPNPSQGLFVVEGADLNSDITVYNAAGIKVYEQKNTLLKKQEIDLARLPDSIYFITVQSGQNKAVRKIVIQK